MSLPFAPPNSSEREILEHELSLKLGEADPDVVSHAAAQQLDDLREFLSNLIGTDRCRRVISQISAARQRSPPPRPAAFTGLSHASEPTLPKPDSGSVPRTRHGIMAALSKSDRESQSKRKRKKQKKPKRGRTARADSASDGSRSDASQPNSKKSGLRLVSRDAEASSGMGLLAGLGQAAEDLAQKQHEPAGQSGSTTGTWESGVPHPRGAPGGAPPPPKSDRATAAAAEADAAARKLMGGGGGDSGGAATAAGDVLAAGASDGRKQEEEAMRYITAGEDGLDLGFRVRAAVRASDGGQQSGGGGAAGWGAGATDGDGAEAGGGAGAMGTKAHVMDLRDKGGSSRASLERGPYCSCMGTLHALWTNCLCCGKVLCEREAGRFCSSCGAPLEHISPSKSQVQDARERASVVTEHHSDILLREHASASQSLLGGDAGAGAVLSGSAPLAFANRRADSAVEEGGKTFDTITRKSDPLGLHKGDEVRMSANARRRLKAERAVASGKGLGFLAPEVSDIDEGAQGPRELVTDADPRADEKLLRMGIDPLAGRMAHNVPMHEAEAMAREARLRIQGSAAQALVSRQHAESQSAAAAAAQQDAGAAMPRPKTTKSFAKIASGAPKKDLPEWRAGKSSRASAPTRSNPIVRSKSGKATLAGMEPEAAAPASKWGAAGAGAASQAPAGLGRDSLSAASAVTAGVPGPVAASAPSVAAGAAAASGVLSDAHMAAFRQTQWLVQQDRNRAAMTSVIDSQNDFYSAQTSAFLTEAERQAAKNAEEERRQRQSGLHQGTYLNITFGGGALTVADAGQARQQAVDDLMKRHVGVPSSGAGAAGGLTAEALAGPANSVTVGAQSGRLVGAAGLAYAARMQQAALKAQEETGGLRDSDSEDETVEAMLRRKRREQERAIDDALDGIGGGGGAFGAGAGAMDAAADSGDAGADGDDYVNTTLSGRASEIYKAILSQHERKARKRMEVVAAGALGRATGGGVTGAARDAATQAAKDVIRSCGGAWSDDRRAGAADGYDDESEFGSAGGAQRSKLQHSDPFDDESGPEGAGGRLAGTSLAAARAGRSTSSRGGGATVSASVFVGVGLIKGGDAANRRALRDVDDDEIDEAIRRSVQPSAAGANGAPARRVPGASQHVRMWPPRALLSAAHAADASLCGPSDRPGFQDGKAGLSSSSSSKQDSFWTFPGDGVRLAHAIRGEPLPECDPSEPGFLPGNAPADLNGPLAADPRGLVDAMPPSSAAASARRATDDALAAASSGAGSSSASMGGGSERVFPRPAFLEGAASTEDGTAAGLSDACLVLDQPQATFVASGMQRFIGQSFRTSHRGGLWIVASSKKPTAKEISAQWASFASMYGQLDDAPSHDSLSYPTGCVLARVDVRQCLPRDEYRRRVIDATSVAQYSEPFLWMAERPCSVGSPGQEPSVRAEEVWQLGRAPAIGGASQPSSASSGFRQSHALCRLAPAAAVRTGSSPLRPVDLSWRPAQALVSEQEAREAAKREEKERRKKAESTPVFDLWRKRPDAPDSDWVGPPRRKEDLVPWAMRRSKGRKVFPELRAARAALEEIEKAPGDVGSEEEAATGEAAASVLARFQPLSLTEQLKQLPSRPPASEAGSARRIIAGAVLLPGALDGELGRSIVAEVRRLGAGKAGFYRPTFKDGAKLHCRIMCLGKHWNNRTNRYEGRRSDHDGLPVQGISEGLHRLSQRLVALASHRDAEVVGARGDGSYEPDLALCNFYRPGEKMGMHQDKSESAASLADGVPVVSMSFGCDAVFVIREVKGGAVLKGGGAEAGSGPAAGASSSASLGREARVRLRHGDALVLGGPARMCLHGVAEIVAGSQPADCDLASGRLNVTVRQLA